MTPGFKALSALALKLVVPLGLVAYAYRFFAINALHLWQVNFALVAAAIGYKVVTIFLYEISVHREARKVGARLAPLVPGSKWRLGSDIVAEQMAHWKYGYPTDGMSDQMAKLGPVVDMKVLYTSLIVTSCPEHIKLILATDFDNYMKGDVFKESMYPLLGTGVFNADGDLWKFHRSITRPFFTKDRISYFDIFSQYSDYTIQQMKKRLREGYPVDIQDLMGRYTIDVATSFLFGTCVDALSSPLVYPHYAKEIDTASDTKAVLFANAFLTAQEQVSERGQLGPIWPLFEMFDDKMKKPMHIINSYVEPLVAAALEKKQLRDPKDKNKNKEIEEDETLLDHLVDQTSDPKILKDETLNILLAGRDTTAATLTFVVYFLSIYPDVMARLRKEVLDKVGYAKPTYDDIKEMKYLRAVINETLRLYPIVPYNIRQNIKATTWPAPDPTEAPIYIPAGTKLLYSVLLMQRRKDLWGPDAEEFDPDRFLDDRLRQYLTPNPFIFLPFNAGPRICLGQQFAYNSVSLMLIRLVQNFESFSFAEAALPPANRPPTEWKSKFAGERKGMEKIRPTFSLTMSSAGGMWVNATEAIG